MRQITRAVLFALLCAHFAPCDAQTTRDGNWWRDQDRRDQVSYVVGFFDGTLLGRDFSYWKFAKDKAADQCTSRVVDSFNEFAERYLKNTSSVQLVDGLNSFYSDYRNRSILIKNAIWLVANEIAGMPRRDFETMVENWRRSGSQ